MLIFDEVARQARATPTRAAIVHAGETWSYADVDAATSAIAAELQKRGLDRDVRIGIMLPRGADNIVVMLGVMRAGAAFVQLELEQPVARLRGIVEDADVRLVVSNRATDVQALLLGRPLLEASALLARRTGVAYDAAPSRAQGALAYVMYTSGSTGAPKGVAVEHTQLSAYLGAVARTMRASEGWSYALVSTLAADISFMSVFGALSTAGTVHVIAEDTLLDGEKWAAYCARCAIDVLNIVPSHLRVLLRTASSGGGVPRRLLACAGEAMSWELVDEVRRRQPDCRIVNGYGPTETTVIAFAYEVPADTTIRRVGETVPIGAPLANVEYHVRNPSAQRHDEGELLIGGDQVARGYLNRPDETAARFLVDPLGLGEDSVRYYCSGDRVRVHPGGVLEFRGRIDRQVKVNGHRVELADVEACIAGHPLVSEAIVIAMDAGTFTARLRAVVVLRRPCSRAVLREHLALQLPAFMMPHEIMIVSSLPVTTNGKTDVGSLASATWNDRGEAADAEVARTPTEHHLTLVWRSVFGRDDVGVNEEFAALGGDSLLAGIALSRLAGSLGVDLPTLVMFEAQTIRRLARMIDQQKSGGQSAPSDPALCGASVASSLEELPIRVQGTLREGCGYNVQLVMEFQGCVDVGRLDASFRRCVTRYEALRTRFDGLQRIVSDDHDPRFRRLDFTDEHRASRDADAILQRELTTTLDLDRGLTLASSYISLPEGQSQLAITCHRAVVDEWALHVLAASIFHDYAGLEAPVEESLSPSVHAARTAAWLESGWRDQLIRFWSARLRNLELARTTRAPSERRSAVLMFRGEEAEDLRRFANSLDVNLLMVIAASLAQALATHREGQELGIGVATPCRSRPDLQEAVAQLENLVVMAIPLRVGLSMSALIEQTHRIFVEGYARLGLPFSILADALTGEHGASISPEIVMRQRARGLPPSRAGAVELKRSRVTSSDEHAPMSVEIEDSGGHISIGIRYDTLLFPVDVATAVEENLRTSMLEATA